MLHSMPPTENSLGNAKRLTDRLRERAADKNIAQREIAKKLGKSQPSVSLYLLDPDKLKAQGVSFVVDFIAAHGFRREEALEMTRELFAEDFRELYGTGEAFKKYLKGNN
jgi:transcriptional regulator with XRE-family HTH domain